uniref:Uncharacterized protein n=1 Tax=Raoultella phage vB_RorM-ISF6 TaxID=1470464 RepID=X2EXD3_9CAUD|nr:hypothetical protein [Raoultella phage vB_RorM-ISF6]
MVPAGGFNTRRLYAKSVARRGLNVSHISASSLRITVGRIVANISSVKLCASSIHATDAFSNDLISSILRAIP